MICCVTGHRPKGFPFPYGNDGPMYHIYKNALLCEIRKVVLMGYTEFISGMADGVDLDFAEYVLYLKNHEEFDIKLEAALPYAAKPTKRPTAYRERKDDILFDCDSVVSVSPSYHKGCMQKRNRYMVDKSDLVIAVWNGEEKGGTWDTIKYARDNNKTIRYIMLNEIKI